MKTYIKTATVTARIFEQGDADGYVEISKGVCKPFIRTLENPQHFGEFGKHYLCYGVQGEKWLVDKDIFERTYKEA